MLKNINSSWRICSSQQILNTHQRTISESIRDMLAKDELLNTAIGLTLVQAKLINTVNTQLNQ